MVSYRRRASPPRGPPRACSCGESDGELPPPRTSPTADPHELARAVKQMVSYRSPSPSADHRTSKLVGVGRWCRCAPVALHLVHPRASSWGSGELCRGAVAHHLVHPRASSWGSGELCRGAVAHHLVHRTSKLVGVGGVVSRRGSSPSGSPTSKLVGVGGVVLRRR